MLKNNNSIPTYLVSTIYINCKCKKGLKNIIGCLTILIGNAPNVTPIVYKVLKFLNLTRKFRVLYRNFRVLSQTSHVSLRRFAFIRESMSLIRASLALYRQSYAFFAKVSHLPFFTYENETIGFCIFQRIMSS